MLRKNRPNFGIRRWKAEHDPPQSSTLHFHEPLTKHAVRAVQPVHVLEKRTNLGWAARVSLSLFNGCLANGPEPQNLDDSGPGVFA